MINDFELIVDRISKRDVRYKEEAYDFVMEALSYTQKKFKSNKHVSGEQLLIGIKELLLSSYGPMAITVLRHWGIKKTEDFGNIIFNLVDSHVLSKTQEDNIEIFRNGYDFEEVFNHGYRRQLAKKISRMRSI